MLQDWFWGTVLSKETAEYRWLPTFSEVDESCESVDLQEEGHCKTLQLTMAVLSPDVLEGEVQEVELVTKDSREADIAVTVAVLVGGSLYQTLLKVELPQVTATLRLKRGAGPVHLIGKEYVDRDIDPDDEQQEEEELDLEPEEEPVETPAQKDTGDRTHWTLTLPHMMMEIDAKKRKKPEAGDKAANGSSKAKRTKVEAAKNGTDEDDEDEDMDEEEADESDEDFSDEEQPPPRGKKAAAKKGAAAAAETAPAKKQAIAKKAGGSAKKGKKGPKGKV